MSESLLTEDIYKVLSGSDIMRRLLSNRPENSYDLNALEKQLNLLCHFCKRRKLDVEKIVNDFINEDKSDNSKLQKLIHQTESQELIDKYYSTTTRFLIELTLRECGLDYKKSFSSIVDFIKKRKIKKVLDFGGGAGGLCVFLNQKGIHCDYADVVGHTWDYAGYRFENEGLKVKQFTKNHLSHVSECYDSIVSLDCLEHLKNLPEYIALFNSMLKKRGWLLVKSTFWGEGDHLQSNHKYNCMSMFNKLLESKGFVLEGQLINRFNKNFLIPKTCLKIFKIKSAGGRNLIYQKKSS